MNKQIEEMAKVLCGMTKPCKDCRFNSRCLAYNSADVLYTAGYRKASEVAREIIAEIEEARERWGAVYIRDDFGHRDDVFCYLETDVDYTIYELKKKYEVTDV